MFVETNQNNGVLQIIPHIQMGTDSYGSIQDSW